MHQYFAQVDLCHRITLYRWKQWSDHSLGAKKKCLELNSVGVLIHLCICLTKMQLQQQESCWCSGQDWLLCHQQQLWLLDPRSCRQHVFSKPGPSVGILQTFGVDVCPSLVFRKIYKTWWEAFIALTVMSCQPGFAGCHFMCMGKDRDVL